jgi:Zn-dependent protease/predicted transcriptional regulator
MFGPRITLFRLFGFEVRVDASWLIIAALVTWSLAVGLFPYKYPGLAPGVYWWMGVVGAAALFGSIVVHELSHSLVARRFGLAMKGITLFVFGGVAEMEEEPANAKVEFLMAVAGPIASILIGTACYLAYRAGRGVWPVPVVGVVAYLFWINWILAAFNLVPAFPLDGGRVLRSALWHHWKGDLPRATRVAAAIGSGFGAVLMVLAVFQLFQGNFVGAVWWFLIGMFLRGASHASYQQMVVRTVLAGEPVRRFMKTDPVTVRPDISIQELVDEYVYRYHYKMFPVVIGSDQLAGCVTTQEIKTIPREQWGRRAVIDVMQPSSRENTIGLDTDAMQALSIMSKTGRSRLMVAEDGRLSGVIVLKDLLSFLSLKLDLEARPAERVRTAHS